MENVAADESARLKMFDCAFRVSTKIPQTVRAYNVEAASWRLLEGVRARLSCGVLKDVRLAIHQADEHLPDGSIKHHGNLRFAREGAARCAVFDVLVDVSGLACVQVAAVSEDDAQAKALDAVQTADFGNLREYGGLSFVVVSIESARFGCLCA